MLRNKYTFTVVLKTNACTILYIRNKRQHTGVKIKVQKGNWKNMQKMEKKTKQA